MSFGWAKLYSNGGGPSLGIAEPSLDPGGSTVKQIPLPSDLGEVPPTETVPHPL